MAQADPAVAFFLETAVELARFVSARPGSGRRGSLAGVVRHGGKWISHESVKLLWFRFHTSTVVGKQML